MNISDFLGLCPACVPEIFHSSLRVTDCDTVLPNAAYWYRIQKCHVIVPKHLLGKLTLEIFRFPGAAGYLPT